MLHYTKKAIESGLGVRIYRNSLPRGTDMFADLDKTFGSRNFRTVLDVGANTGQSAKPYLANFPNASIYSFEPVPATHEKLAILAKANPRLKAFCCAMGRERGEGNINVNPVDRLSSVVRCRPEDRVEAITFDTIDHFCSENRLESIDLLKIDTEGYELEVLAGAEEILKRQGIRFLIAECAPNKRDFFVSFHSLSETLSEFEYQLFGIYTQEAHWDGRRALEFCNPLFICRALAQSKPEAGSTG